MTALGGVLFWTAVVAVLWVAARVNQAFRGLPPGWGPSTPKLVAYAVIAGGGGLLLVA